MSYELGVVKPNMIFLDIGIDTCAPKVEKYYSVAAWIFVRFFGEPYISVECYVNLQHWGG